MTQGQQENAMDSEKSLSSVEYLLAGLIYMEGIKPSKRKDAVPFDRLTEEERQPFVSQAIMFLMYLDKINFAVVPKQMDTKEAVSMEQERETLAGIISEFLKGVRTTKPGLFPSMELAARIQEGLGR